MKHPCGVFNGQWYRWRGAQHGSGPSTPTGTTMAGTSRPTRSTTRTGGMLAIRSCPATLFFPHLQKVGFLQVSLYANRRPSFRGFQLLPRVQDTVFVREFYIPTLSGERIGADRYFARLSPTELFSHSRRRTKLPLIVQV